MASASDLHSLYWDGHVPVDVVRIANALGIEVRSSAGMEPAMAESGMIEIENGRPVITFNAAEALVRRRFTVAHEIGHFALGHLSGATKLFRDPVSNFSTDSNAFEERAANAFAAQLLMPAGTLRYAVQTGAGKTLDELARLFGVSQVAMSLRLRTLGIVDG